MPAGSTHLPAGPRRANLDSANLGRECTGRPGRPGRAAVALPLSDVVQNTRLRGFVDPARAPVGIELYGAETAQGGVQPLVVVERQPVDALVHRLPVGGTGRSRRAPCCSRRPPSPNWATPGWKRWPGWACVPVRRAGAGTDAPARAALRVPGPPAVHARRLEPGFEVGAPRRVAEIEAGLKADDKRVGAVLQAIGFKPDALAYKARFVAPGRRLPRAPLRPLRAAHAAGSCRPCSWAAHRQIAPAWAACSPPGRCGSARSHRLRSAPRRPASRQRA